LQDYNDNEIEDAVMQLMDVVFNRYEATRHLILPGNLVEITYENLLQNPVQVVGELYDKLNLKGFEQVLPSLREFTNQNLHHQVASYKFKPGTIRRVNSIWRNLFDRMGYIRLKDSGD
jgi:LPS sulfotransferase NodH